MRMRRRNNLAPRMAACEPVWIHEPETLRGNWRSLMPGCRELRVEVGCGKGKFTVETAAAEPDVLLIAIERVQDALVLIAISVLLTVVAGLLPARSASKKDPVEALRSE